MLVVCCCTTHHPELPHSEAGSGAHRLLTWLLGSPRASTPRDRRWKLPASRVWIQKPAPRVVAAVCCPSQSSTRARPGESRGRRQPHLPRVSPKKAAGCHVAPGCWHVAKGLGMGAVPPAWNGMRTPCPTGDRGANTCTCSPRSATPLPGFAAVSVASRTRRTNCFSFQQSTQIVSMIVWLWGRSASRSNAGAVK